MPPTMHGTSSAYCSYCKQACAKEMPSACWHSANACLMCMCMYVCLVSSDRMHACAPEHARTWVLQRASWLPPLPHPYQYPPPPAALSLRPRLHYPQHMQPQHHLHPSIHLHYAYHAPASPLQWRMHVHLDGPSPCQLLCGWIERVLHASLIAGSLVKCTAVVCLCGGGLWSHGQCVVCLQRHGHGCCLGRLLLLLLPLLGPATMMMMHACLPHALHVTP